MNVFIQRLDQLKRQGERIGNFEEYEQVAKKHADLPKDWNAVLQKYGKEQVAKFGGFLGIVGRLNPCPDIAPAPATRELDRD